MKFKSRINNFVPLDISYKMKTKTVLFFLPFFLIPILTIASDKDSSKVKPGAFISLNGGLGIPFSYNKSNEGIFESYATNGSSLNISTTIPIKNSIFGITGMVGYSNNTFEVGNYIDNTAKISGFNLLSENLDEYTVMAGISLPIILPRFLFDFRLMGGALYFTVAGNQYYAVDSTPQISPIFITYTTTLNLNPNKDISLALDLGASVKFFVSKEFFVLLSFDYLYAQPNLEYTLTIQNYNTKNGYAFPNITTMNYNTPFTDVQLFNLTIGMGFNIGK